MHTDKYFKAFLYLILLLRGTPSYIKKKSTVCDWGINFCLKFYLKCPVQQLSALKNNMFKEFVHQYREISVLVRKIKQMALSCYFFSVFFSFFPSISFLNDSGGSNSESIEHDKYSGVFISKFETFLGKLLCSIVADRFHYFHVSNWDYVPIYVCTVSCTSTAEMLESSEGRKHVHQTSRPGLSGKFRLHLIKVFI